MKQAQALPRTLQGGAWLLTLFALASCGNWFGGPSTEIPNATEFPDAEAPLPLRSPESPLPSAKAESSSSPGAVVSTSPTASPKAVLGPFDEDPTLNQSAATHFKPQLDWSLDDPKFGATPKVSISVYQTKGELEVREARFLLEGTAFRFENLRLKQKVGGGSLDIGTPPKLSLPITLTVEELDLGVPTAVFSVIADGPGARVHVADLKIKPTSEGLSIISLGNLARANDARGTHTTEYSAKVTQIIDSGWFVLPLQKRLRTRVSFLSEADPQSGEVAILTQWPSFTLLP